MKTLLTLLFVACLITSCSDGSRDKGFNRVLDNERSLTQTPPLEVGQLGALSGLIGEVDITYAFSDSSTEFSVALNYSAGDYAATSGGGGTLSGQASTYMTPDSTAQALSTGKMLFLCGHTGGSNEYLCVLDPDGGSESLFVFGGLSNGTASGSFEFCSEASIEACVDRIRASPDGMASLRVSSSSAKSIVANEEESADFDVLPYYQYLKQGSTEANGVVMSDNSELLKTARAIKEAFAGQ